MPAAHNGSAVHFNYGDRAVFLSKWIHKATRAGIEGKDLPDTDSILRIDSWFSLDFLGHGYFANAAPVLRDIQALIVHDKTPTASIDSFLATILNTGNCVVLGGRKPKIEESRREAMGVVLGVTDD
jgi:hypothetical protein